MKKKWFVIVGGLLSIMLLTSVVLANSTVKVWINGQLFEPETAPQLVEGKVIVPLKETAEAIGGKVEWNQETKEVNVKIPSITSLEQQVRLLETAVAAETPEEAVNKWVKAIKLRNGALEYALLSPALKERELSSFEEVNWITGTSSPWVERYKIDQGEENKDGTWTFQVQLDYRTSVDIEEPERWEEIPAFPVTVEEQAGFWYIADFPTE